MWFCVQILSHRATVGMSRQTQAQESLQCISVTAKWGMWARSVGSSVASLAQKWIWWRSASGWNKLKNIRGLWRIGKCCDKAHCLHWTVINWRITEIFTTFAGIGFLFLVMTVFIVCWLKAGPARTILAFCRRRGVHGSIQNSFSLNRPEEFQWRNANCWYGPASVKQIGLCLSWSLGLDVCAFMYVCRCVYVIQLLLLLQN